MKALLWAAVAVVATIILLFSIETRAQPQCRSFNEIAQVLVKGPREVPHSASFTHVGTTLVIFVNPETGTWTAVESQPDGKCSRIASHGTSWRDIEVLPSGDKS